MKAEGNEKRGLVCWCLQVANELISDLNLAAEEVFLGQGHHYFHCVSSDNNEVLRPLFK